MTLPGQRQPRFPLGATTPATSPLRRFVVFLASPRDVDEERAHAARIVDNLRKIFESQMGIVLCLRRWEDLPPGSGRPQSQINPWVDESHLFVGILYKRWGTKTGRYSSGFEEEFQRAFRLCQRTGLPDLCIFLRDPKGSGKSRRIGDLKRKHAQHLKWTTYESPQEFADMLHEALLYKVLGSRSSGDPSAPAGAKSIFPEAVSGGAMSPTIELHRAESLVDGAPLDTTSWTAQGLAKTELPTLTSWSSAFRSAYEYPQRNYNEYRRRMRESALAPASDDERVEQAINLCVEREPRRAMAALDALDLRGWPSLRRAVLHRLKGVLFFEQGNGRAALSEYRKAQRLAHESPSLRKALKFDLHRLEPLDWKEGFKRAERTRRLDGWLGTPAIDSAIQASSDSFAKDLFFEIVRPEGGHRFSTGSSGSVGKYNLALAIAYLTGDLESVQDARKGFARQMAMSAKLRRDMPAAKVALEEAVAGGAEDIVAEILGAFGSELAE